MFYCIDANNHIVHIEDYCIESKLNGAYLPVFCPFCGKELIFQQLRSEYINSLDTSLFIKTLKKIANPKTLKLRNLTYPHIPYIWLNELSKFNNKVYLYTNSRKLDLTNLQFKMPYLWNTTEKKDIIITAEENTDKTISRTITPIDSNFLDYNTDCSYKFLSEITSLKIFDVFSLTSEKYEIILKELLDIAK